MTTESPEWEYVEDTDGLRRVVKAVERARVVAVDTESDSMHSYFEKVCLFQIATEEAAFLVDTLALKDEMGRLGPAFADPAIRKIFHGADYDVVCLKRDYGWDIRNIFDTMIAAQFLDFPKIGLADLVSEFFGESLDKRHSRTNWAKRPLSASELKYSYLDVKFLIELVGILEERLREEDVLEEAELEFGRMEQREQAPREFDPDGYTRIRGSRDLDDRSRAVLRELFLLRDRNAQRLDRPPFKVIANDTLLRIATRCPRSRSELRGIKGVTTYVLRRYGEGMLKAVAQGVKRGKAPKPRSKKSKGVRLSPPQQRQLERLRDWRKERAAEIGKPTLVILPNHAILDVVKARPKDLDALGAIATVGEKRARRHGEQILAVLRGG